eukprot:TRINITY_DN43593_c0_g1_i1.p1 TRINITY_DN43593_c0_g1~~TRINITY_DN43593_c0_g1_i1.p1  ORF type:complete len:461 (-),score=64.07 TRINITY_DN43593_c0_g1_i1:158-1540(-)
MLAFHRRWQSQCADKFSARQSAFPLHPAQRAPTVTIMAWFTSALCVASLAAIAAGTCKPSATRVDCGYFGITQSECSSRGCCWQLPSQANLTSTDLPICFRQFARKPIEFFVHYLPWMKGPSSAHWCNSKYGNSYYGSVIGQWSCEDESVLLWQAGLMKEAGIDGIFFDYQHQDWNSCVDKMVVVLKELGLKYALMPDTAEGAGFLADAVPYMREKFQDSNYARHNGKPLLPMFDFTGDKAPSVSKLRRSLGDVFVVGRLQGDLLSGADAYYPWISGSDPDSVDSYYRNPPAGTEAVVGGAWRGFEACYAMKQPYLDHYVNAGLLRGTVAKAKHYNPPFVQLMTWDDYTEGTMIEPSFLIHDKINGCNSIKSCANGENQGGSPDCSVPYCADGHECNKKSPHCSKCNGGRLCSPYRDLIVLYHELVGGSKSDEEIEAIFKAIPKPAGAPYGEMATNVTMV